MLHNDNQIATGLDILNVSRGITMKKKKKALRPCYVVCMAY